VQYAYDSTNKRVWKGTISGGSMTAQEVYLYGLDSQKLATYAITANAGSTPYLANSATNLAAFFRSRRVGITTSGTTTAFIQNRLGSQGNYYPFGEARGTVPVDAVGFATYTQDSATGLDYADQRYYANNFGRFMSPDPYKGSGGTKSPSSWNRYSYTRGDPVNSSDHRGLEDHPAKDSSGSDGDCGQDDEDYCGSSDDGGGGGDPSNSGGDEAGSNSDDNCSSTFCVTGTGSMPTTDDPSDDSSDDSNDGSDQPEPDPGPGEPDALCVLASEVTGAAAGGAVGSFFGGIFGGGIGGAGGTLVLPGVGTIGGGAAGFGLGATAGGLFGAGLGSAIGGLIGNIFCAEHVSNQTPSNLPKHQKGTARKKGSRGTSTHPYRAPRKRPTNWKGPWPPPNWPLK
jgi:RHS repeat-associated protein